MGDGRAATSPCFYTCFQTSWSWNKDTVLLYSIHYCTVQYTKAQPVVEDARVWQCTCVNYTIGHANAHSHLWKFATWRFVLRWLTLSALFSLGNCFHIAQVKVWLDICFLVIPSPKPSLCLNICLVNIRGVDGSSLEDTFWLHCCQILWPDINI